MTRKIKNILMLLLVILLVVINYFTINYANNNGSKMPMNMENNNGTLPDMNNNMKEEPPSKPSNENISSNTSEMPEKNNNMGEPPSKPNGDNNMTPPNQNGMSNINDKNNNSVLYYILFIVEDLGISLIISYLIMSNFIKNTFKRTFKSSGRIKGYLLITIILTCGLVYLDNYFMNKNDSNFDNKNINGEFNNNNISSDAKGEKEIEDSQELTDEYETNNSDTSVLLVKNGGNLTLNDATVTKLSGDSTNTENSEFYGINAGILVTSNSTTTIKNSKIYTNAKGSNAVFSTGTNSKIYINDSVITTTGLSSARGLDATYGGYIEADNVEITTQGGSCATLATDRGEGTVIATNSKLVTNGTGSPIIYSTGNISITNTTGTANGSQMVVIEGKNSATIIDSTLDASGKGNRGDVDQSGIMIYQSMSGDASEGTGTLTVTNSNLTIQSDSTYYKTAPMFFITNTDAVINLENTKLNYGSNILISAKGTSEWGTSESNGGKLVLNAINQTLNGDIVIDKISTLNMILKSSSYKGTINEDNTAQSITLKLDKSSKITLTGNSYITSLDNEDSTNSNIDFNGYKLFVNGDSIN